jgi:hypothetical protein
MSKCGLHPLIQRPKSLGVAFARLCRMFVSSVLGLENESLSTTQIRDRIDAHVTNITTWTTLLGALEQKTPEILEIPSSTMGEVARSIRGSVAEIQNLVDALATQSNVCT